MGVVCPESAVHTGQALFAYPGGGRMRGDDALFTAAEVEELTTPDRPGAKPTVTRHLVYMWRRAGLLVERGRRGRSPLYRWGDVQAVEQRQARAAWEANNHRARRVA